MRQFQEGEVIKHTRNRMVEGSHAKALFFVNCILIKRYAELPGWKERQADRESSKDGEKESAMTKMGCLDGLDLEPIY